MTTSWMCLTFSVPRNSATWSLPPAVIASEPEEKNEPMADLFDTIEIDWTCR